MAERSTRIEGTVEVPDLIGRDLVQAQSIAEECGVTLRGDTGTGTIVWQYPAPDRLAFVGEEIVVATALGNHQKQVMVDLCGLSIRQASAFMQAAGIKYTVEGNGRVVKQSVKPGKPLDEGMECRVICRPT